MQKNSEYQEKVESNFGRPLKDIMHDLCRVKKPPKECASLLGVPISTFINWMYIFGKEDINDVEIIRPLLLQEDDKSILGFKELVERHLELCELERTKGKNFGTEVWQTELTVTLSLIDTYLRGNSEEEYLICAEKKLRIEPKFFYDLN